MIQDLSVKNSSYDWSPTTVRYRKRLQRTKKGDKLLNMKTCMIKYIPSYYDGLRKHRLFKDVKTYCLFIGTSRNADSMFGALLDAHPHAVISDELDSLIYVEGRLKFNRDQIFSLILRQSRYLADRKRQKGGRDGKTYSHWVPNQWQGRFERIQVIGDSKSGKSSYRLGNNPEILSRWRNLIGNANLRVIQMMRNPYDNISTMMIRGGRSFENAIHHYFDRCASIAKVRNLLKSEEILVMRHEEYIAQPEKCLINAYRFLGLEERQDIIKDCAEIVYKKPAQSRHKIPWTSELIDMVQRKIDEYEFLAGYSFES